MRRVHTPPFRARLLILDVMLPDSNGFALMEQLQAFTDVPVIFLTAKDEPRDKLAGLGLGERLHSKAFLAVDLLILFLFYYFSRRKILKNAEPIANSIEALSHGQPVSLSDGARHRFLYFILNKIQWLCF